MVVRERFEKEYRRGKYCRNMDPEKQTSCISTVNRRVSLNQLHPHRIGAFGAHFNFESNFIMLFYFFLQ